MASDAPAMPLCPACRSPSTVEFDAVRNLWDCFCYAPGDVCPMIVKATSRTREGAIARFAQRKPFAVTDEQALNLLMILWAAPPVEGTFEPSNEAFMKVKADINRILTQR